jgi:hypothetical protein
MLVCAGPAFAVFGLGTDGESTPEMMAKALENIGEYHVGDFDGTVLRDVERFYRDIVEPNRYSRTADFTLRQIRQRDNPHENPARFRARFHTRPTAEESRSYLGIFLQSFEPSYYGRYYLFDRLDGVRNPFAVACSHGVEWFLRIQKVASRINHEIQGQAYADVRSILGLPACSSCQSLYLGTPSRKFPRDVTERIIQDVIQSLRNRVYNTALVYRGDLQGQDHSDLSNAPVGDELVILARDLDADVLAELFRLTDSTVDQARA